MNDPTSTTPMTLDELIALNPAFAQVLSLKMSQPKHSLFREEDARRIEAAAPSPGDANALYWRARPDTPPKGAESRPTEENWQALNRWWDRTLQENPRVLLMFFVYCWMEKEQTRASVVKSMKALEGRGGELAAENARLQGVVRQHEQDLAELVQGLKDLKQALLARQRSGGDGGDGGNAALNVALSALGGHLLGRWL